VQTAGTFAGALLLPRVVGVIGKKYTYISAGAIAIVGGIGVALRHASLYL
jgi:hypothetical protein